MGKREKRAAEEATDQSPQDGKLRRKEYEAKLDELHMELVKMQYWAVIVKSANSEQPRSKFDQMYTADE